jgi:hypothetical protein
MMTGEVRGALEIITLYDHKSFPGIGNPQDVSNRDHAGKETFQTGNGTAIVGTSRLAPRKAFHPFCDLEKNLAKIPQPACRSAKECE